VRFALVRERTQVSGTLSRLPDLKKIDAVWCVHTMSWKSEGDAMFCHIWPGGVKERFWIRDERFSGKKTVTNI